MGKSKVRTGCRTCKIRKVKCDEKYPVCHRCSSTGRICDGYGVWGGGGNQTHRDSRDRAIIASTSSSSNEPCNTVLPRPGYVSFFVASREDKECFHWFACRTSVKLKGSFDSEFWSKLILQASINELAVRHAVLAVSYVHRRGSLDVMDTRLKKETTGQVDQVPLRYFARSINHLQHHLSANTQASLRIVLITCIILTTLDLLRGHFETARIHVKNGVYLVRKLRSFSNRDDRLHSTRVAESTDSWIAEAFMRLHGQVEVHNIMKRVTCEPLLPSPSPIPSIQKFFSVKEAWNHLDKILEQIIHLNNRVLESETECQALRSPPPLLRADQQQIQTALSSWLKAYKSLSSPLIQRYISPWEKKFSGLLLLHHQTLTIMTDVCLSPRNEMVFDAHTDSFLRLINHAVDLWNYTLSTNPHRPKLPPGQFLNMSNSITDKGWITALYYTAVKCRIHRIRLQAVRFLQSSHHREGFWDSSIMAAVARKVMEIEERDYYQDINPLDNIFSLTSSPTPWDLSLPTLPESYRLRGVETILSGCPVNRVLLLCKQRQNMEDQKVQIGEYDILTQRWSYAADSNFKAQKSSQIRVGHLPFVSRT
ncbi:conserved hypothetical protein [Talaromyces stipitatus ATCC 10500]|uniref:Zn(2)-C6 fungal-type domain-containing protein n=1 Tax=Talaromyces stipitatus (strain ATCC 10500 / CBS 375.48 / QM 6759 / NRRL 1006) TaxID=441959 RepID=B8MFX9_TALSN|nr:uncharacterized protein TSTA_009670 [Talaromyces stipitatus ATCC 10500]EED15846.1 conserved hypothetical protein [Talaromyces stipitatus ATCC 10500]